uniref:suppressor of fused homolog n=1 Tax=Ciona intestinalis TaxID=7719 RepID=UPI000180D420|nr:suppressor of fused homolog [Ciona intestinalis]|eukprot:XP_002129739.1 suppressor of fused homolog [Ciona intestinalis]
MLRTQSTCLKLSRPMAGTFMQAAQEKTYARPPSNSVNMVPTPPPGLDAIYQACRNVYHDQPNPLQVTAVIKYWLGGPDPLDYVSMYYNKGDPERNIPEHWHYITFGFSDLHGDGRVHPTSNSDGPSGFGFELTMRLKREPGESGPPTWPAELLQALARYVFQSENALYSGDHVSWHAPLDNCESRLQHMLMTDDAQLPMVTTPIGSVNFIQVVGVCTEELQAAQQWNGPGVIELLKTIPLAGGPWLVTDMRRGETIFEIDPSLQESVDEGIRQNGSNLSGVSAKCTWIESTDAMYGENGDELHLPPKISEEVSNQIKDALLEGLGRAKHQALPSVPSRELVSRENDVPHEMVYTRTLDAVHLKFNLEAGSLLALACKGRVLHGRHFTFKSVNGDTAVTFVATGVEGAFVNERNPYAARGPWLQVLVTEDLAYELIRDLEELTSIDTAQLPKSYRWPRKRLEVSILPDPSFDSILPMEQFPT